MIQVRVTTFEFDVARNEWSELPVAELVADAGEVTISGPRADWIDPEIAIIDPTSRERVTLVDDAERWARLLPFAYRNGDLAFEIADVAVAEPASASFHYLAEA